MDKSSTSNLEQCQDKMLLKFKSTIKLYYRSDLIRFVADSVFTILILWRFFTQNDVASILSFIIPIVILFLLNLILSLYLLWNLVISIKLKRETGSIPNGSIFMEKIYHLIIKLCQKRHYFKWRKVKKKTKEESREVVICSLYNIVYENVSYSPAIIIVYLFMVIFTFSIDIYIGILYVFSLILFRYDYRRQKITLQWMQAFLDIFRWQNQIDEIPVVENNQNYSLMEEDFAQYETSHDGDISTNES